MQDATTAEFDRILEQEKAEADLHFKLLCLGAGESGKSTVSAVRPPCRLRTQR
jgi:hypothetical protein